MEFLASVFDGGDEAGSFQQGEVLADGLAGHTHVAAEVVQGAAVFFVKTVEQFSPGFVGQGFKDCIHYVGREYATVWLHVK